MERQNDPKRQVVTRRQQAQRRAETRAGILAATIEVLNEKGYSGASMAEIVATAGVSLGAVQYHFPSKARLMAAVADVFYMRRLSHLREKLRGVRDPHERGRATLRASWEFALTPEFAAGLEIELARRTDRELREETARLYERQYGFLKRWTDIQMRKMGGQNPAAKEVWRFMNNALYRGLATLAIAGYPLSMKDDALAAFSDSFFDAILRSEPS